MRRDEAEVRAGLLLASLGFAWVADAAAAGLFEFLMFLTAVGLFIAAWVPWDEPKQRG